MLISHAWDRRFIAKPTLDSVLWGKHDGDGKKLAAWQSMTSGFFAALVGPCATGPFDVAKTRLMAQSKSGEQKYKGFFDVLIKIPREVRERGCCACSSNVCDQTLCIRSAPSC